MAAIVAVLDLHLHRDLGLATVDAPVKMLDLPALDLGPDRNTKPHSCLNLD